MSGRSLDLSARVIRLSGVTEHWDNLLMRRLVVPKPTTRWTALRAVGMEEPIHLVANVSSFVAQLLVR
jgi:hypothetical protein